MLSSLLLLALAAPPQDGVREIPGLVEVPAGATWIGAEQKELETLIQEHPESAKVIGGMGPRSQVQVERFFISPTEVTNEMYLEFVKATGHIPPTSWATVDREMRLALLLAFQKDDPTAQWDQVFPRWWREHWQEEEWTGTTADGKEKTFPIRWEMPAEQALFPVVDLDYYDALDYCRWAGLRLPTEEEWVRAARGDDTRVWPWGDEFDKSLVAFQDTRPVSLRRKLLPVNTFPGNASPFGCVDMAGNVAEWTASPYVELPGFRPFSVTIKKTRQKVQVEPDFDPTAAVVRGGAYTQPADATRIDSRVGLYRNTRALVLGFRVAASAVAGLDAIRLASAEMKGGIFRGATGRHLQYEMVLGLQHHRVADMQAAAAARKAPPKPFPAVEPPKGYAIPAGHEALAVVPVKEFPYPSLDRMRKAVEKQGAAVFGVLHTTVALAEPNVPPGTYYLAYLGELEPKAILERGGTLPPEVMKRLGLENEPPPEVEPREAPWIELAGVQIRPNRETLLIVDQERKARGAIEMRLKPSTVVLAKAKPAVVLNLDRDDVVFRMVVPAGGRRAWQFQVTVRPVGPEGSLVREGWWAGQYQVVRPKPEQ